MQMDTVQGQNNMAIHVSLSCTNNYQIANPIEEI